MACKSSLKILFTLFISMCLLLTSCHMPIISQSSDEDGEISDDSPRVYEPIATGETTYHLSPVEDVQCNLFVAPNGDDDNPGSETQPWASFQWAADSASPGDTVCFKGGTYTTEDIHIINSGDEDDLITFIAFADERPILDGGGSANELLVVDGGVAHVRISGFKLQNFRVWGIFLSGSNHHVYLDHLEVMGGETSIRFTYGESAESPALEGPVEHILLQDSLIHGSEYSAVDCTPGPCNYMTVRRLEIFNTGMVGDAFFGSDGLEFARGHDVLVEDCYVHDNGGDGIDLGSRDRGGHMQGIIVRRNTVVRNRLNGIKVWSGGRIENNIIWGQGDSAIWSGTYHCDIEIINNTIAYNMWKRDIDNRNWAVVVGYPEELPKPEVNLTMANNIVAFNADPMEGGPTGVYFGAGVQLIEGHNLYYSSPEEEITLAVGDGIAYSREDIDNGVWASRFGQGEGNLTLDPLFVSGWPEVDLRLQSNSPAINSGWRDLATDVDILGAPRGDQPDIGAYEQ